MAWTNRAWVFLVLGVLVIFVVMIAGDRIRLPGGFEIRLRKEVRIVGGVVGVSLFVWGCVLGVAQLV